MFHFVDFIGFYRFDARKCFVGPLHIIAVNPKKEFSFPENFGLEVQMISRINFSKDEFLIDSSTTSHDNN